MAKKHSTTAIPFQAEGVKCVSVIMIILCFKPMISVQAELVISCTRVL